MVYLPNRPSSSIKAEKALGMGGYNSGRTQSLPGPSFGGYRYQIHPLWSRDGHEVLNLTGATRQHSEGQGGTTSGELPGDSREKGTVSF